MNRNSQFKKIPSQNDLNGIYPVLSNKNGWDVEVGQEFSTCYLKTKDNSLLLIISLKSGRVSNVPSAATVWLLGME